MKYLFYVAALGVAIAVGFGKGILQRSALRAILAWGAVAVGIVLGLFPPIVGTFSDAATEAKFNRGAAFTVLIPVGGVRQIDSTDLECRDIAGHAVICRGSNETIKTVMAHSNNHNLLLHTRLITHSLYDITALESAPRIMLPHIPALGEKARIIFFHVPAAWTGFFAYIVTMLYSILYLRRKKDEYDIIALSSASIGTLFTALAYASGAVWAKFNWGHFFNWDSRELSVLLLLAIYAAYFVLRSNVKGNMRKRVSATYAVVAAVAAVFLIFIVPRITISLHPGSRDDVNIGPILSPEQDALDLTKAMVFSIMLAGFTLFFTWMLNVVARYNRYRYHQLGSET